MRLYVPGNDVMVEPLLIGGPYPPTPPRPIRRLDLVVPQPTPIYALIVVGMLVLVGGQLLGAIPLPIDRLMRTVIPIELTPLWQELYGIPDGMRVFPAVFLVPSVVLVITLIILVVSLQSQ